MAQNSPLILTLLIVAFTSSVAVIAAEWRVKRPLAPVPAVAAVGASAAALIILIWGTP
jgi:hypothetical protein